MPQGEENAPLSAEDQQRADQGAGWDTAWGPAPFEHGLPVAPLEVAEAPPVVTEW